MKLVLLALADHASSDGFCWPGQEGVAEKCSVKPRALRDSLTRLEEDGYVQRRKRRTPVGEYLSDSYQLQMPSGSPLPTDQRQSTAISSGSPLPPNRKEEPSREENRVFEHWKERFGLNGRQRLTPERRKKIQTRLRAYPLEDVLQAIDNVAASSWHRENGKFDLELILRTDTNLEKYRDMSTGVDAEKERRRYDPWAQIDY